MIEIIPAIIPKFFQEIEEKIKLVEPYVDWVQLDVMDGKFVNNLTWTNPNDLKSLNTNLNLEVHLMINNPEEAIDDWIESGVKRIIIHYESTDKHKEIIEKVKRAGLEIGLAINPETSIEVIDEFYKDIDLVLIMSVNPGFGNQDFLNESVDKIRQLRERYKNVNIEVDGGVNLETAPNVIKAGANILISGSAIFKSNNIEETIKKLKG